MVATIFVCAVKIDGTIIVSFSEGYWSHECSVFKFNFSNNKDLMQELTVTEYGTSALDENINFFVNGTYFPEECTDKLMKNLLNAETCFILFPSFMTNNNYFETMLEKLKTNLEWMYKINYNDDVILMNPRETPRHVFLVKS